MTRASAESNVPPQPGPSSQDASGAPARTVASDRAAAQGDPASSDEARAGPDGVRAPADDADVSHADSRQRVAQSLSPAALLKLASVGLSARLVVDGLFAGRHRSPRLGHAVEFAEHRQYVPGEDPRYLDWKVLAKHDRLVIKHFEHQTSLRAHLVVDASASMGYRHGSAMSKLQYASHVAAALAYLMQRQHDAAGLIVVGAAIRQHVPARTGKGHLASLWQELDFAQAGGQTRLADALENLAVRVNRRALFIVLSDLFDDASASGEPRANADRANAGRGDGDADADPSRFPPALDRALAKLRHHKHEVMVMQVLDPSEITFPFDDLGRIDDLETQRHVTGDTTAMAQHYRDQIRRFVLDAKRRCLSHRAQYALALTDEPLDRYLSRCLSESASMPASLARWAREGSQAKGAGRRR